MRIGHGFDIHAFGNVGPLVLAGVSIPNSMRLVAHSDGDVILHSLIDALLGATALGDIGTWFPDDNMLFKNINSRILLKKVWKKVKKKYFLKNIDITIIAQFPKLFSYIFQMRSNISKDLNLNIENISIKSTTVDKLGLIGKGSGIACETLVLIDSLTIKSNVGK